MMPGIVADWMMEWAERRAGSRKAWPIDFEAVVLLQAEVSASAPDLSTLLPLVAKRARELTGACGAMIEMREQDGLVCRAACGSASRLLGLRTKLVGGLSGLALTTGQIVTCDDAPTDGRVDRSVCESMDVGSMLVVPARSRGTSSGVLVVASPHRRAFGHEHQQILRLVVGMLTSRLDLMEEVQARQLLLTENAVAVATLQESESRFRSAFDHSGIGMGLMATDGRWLKVNAPLCRMFGYSRDEMLLRSHQSDTHPDDRELDVPFVQKILAGEIATYELEKRHVNKEGSVVWGLLTISSVTGAGREPLYLIAKIQDITARKHAEEGLRRLADRDDLTGLYNRREMLRLLRQETSRSDRHRRPVSLIMLDVDGFKKVNDTHGHPAGDSALQQISRIVEECVRSFDRVARYGGEEFAVILPETSGADALSVAERIRARVAEQELSIHRENGADLRIPLTISAGVATITRGHETAVERLIGDADANLYAAKNGGRNRCVAVESAVVDSNGCS